MINIHLGKLLDRDKNLSSKVNEIEMNVSEEASLEFSNSKSSAALNLQIRKNPFTIISRKRSQTMNPHTLINVFMIPPFALSLSGLIKAQPQLVVSRKRAVKRLPFANKSVNHAHKSYLKSIRPTQPSSQRALDSFFSRFTIEITT